MFYVSTVSYYISRDNNKMQLELKIFNIKKSISPRQKRKLTFSQKQFFCNVSTSNKLYKDKFVDSNHNKKKQNYMRIISSEFQDEIDAARGFAWTDDFHADLVVAALVVTQMLWS